jgi:hypothetical protein
MAGKTPTSFTVPATALIDPQTGITAFQWVKWFQGVQQSIAAAPTVSFGIGAPGGTSNEGYLYFDTTGSPYHGYVWHSGAWHIFS